MRKYCIILMIFTFTIFKLQSQTLSTYAEVQEDARLLVSDWGLKVIIDFGIFTSVENEIDSGQVMLHDNSVSEYKNIKSQDEIFNKVRIFYVQSNLILGSSFTKHIDL